MRRGRLSKPDNSKGFSRNPTRLREKLSMSWERSATLFSVRETLQCEGVAVKVWVRANEGQAERRKGKVQGGKGGGMSKWDCSCPYFLGLCVRAEKRLQTERPRRGRKSQAERARQGGGERERQRSVRVFPLLTFSPLVWGLPSLNVSGWSLE